MIAKFMTEGFAARKNTEMDRKLSLIVKNALFRILLPKEKFSFNLPDGKPGNWFFLPDKEEGIGYLVFSYSIHDKVWKETEVAASVYTIEGTNEPFVRDTIAFSVVDKRNKTEAELKKFDRIRSEKARSIVKKASMASCIEDVVKVFTLERKKRARQRGMMG